MSKVLNPHLIKSTLKRRNARHGMLMRQTCFRPLEHDKRCLRLVSTYPNPPPAELTPEEFAAGGPYYEFILVPEVAQILERIDRWLRGAIERKESWIEKKDSDGRVTRLRNVKTLEDALALCEQDGDRLRRAWLIRRDLAHGNNPRHVNIAQRFDDGGFAVELKTPSALRWEARHMRHCLSNATYARRLRMGDVAYFSIRDPKGRPRVTLEVIGGCVTQCRGRANSDPFASYSSKIACLADAMGWDGSDHQPEEPRQLERFDLDQMVFDTDVTLSDRMLPLARMLHVNGTLEAVDLDGLTSLPAVMRIRGDLILRRCNNLRHMPRWLHVEGNAHIEECGSVTELGTNFYAGGSLVVRDCPQIRLNAQHAIVGRTLVVRRTPGANVPRAAGS
jgi:PcfJ-like protein